MHLGVKQTIVLVKKILKRLKKSKNKGLSKLDIVVCPSFISLSEAAKVCKSKILLGAQDCFWEEQGEFTGKISPVWLKKLGCKYVIIGHSEQRTHIRETDEMVHKKVKAVIKAGLIPIICVGETLDEKRRGLKEYVILNQVSRALAGIILNKRQKIILAYEPVWVIGSGHAITPEQAEYMHKIIRQRMIDLFPLNIVKNNIRLIYGGSVNAGNICLFTRLDTVDGALVGSASLNAKEFVKLMEAVC